MLDRQVSKALRDILIPVVRSEDLPGGMTRDDILQYLDRLEQKDLTASVTRSEFTKVHFQTGLDMSEIEMAALRTEPTEEQYAVTAERLDDMRTIRLLHAAMGMVTEAGEFLDMLKKHIFYGKPIDGVNALEEMGDASWYQRIGCAALEVSFTEMLLRNVRKLKHRYPEKFTEEKAVTRDLPGERGVLEGK